MAHTATTLNSDAAWRPDLNTFLAADVVPDAAILQASTVAGSIEGDQPVVRVAFVDDDEAVIKAEGAALDEAEPTLDEVAISTKKVTQLVRLSREQYGQAGTAEQLGVSVQRAIIKRADTLFLAEPTTGLVNTAGLVNGGAVSGDLDTLIDLEATLRENGATPSLFVVAPSTWAALRRLKAATGSNTNLLGAGTDDAEPRLLSVPVLVNNQVPSGTGLLVDSTAVVSAVGTVQLATSDQVYFASDSVALRATWRIGHAVPRPNRVGKFTVPTGS